MNYEPDGYGGPERQYSSHQSTEENMRRYENLAASKGSTEKIDRTNLAVQLVNGQISPSAKCAQIQPKMMREGRFPSDFRTPRTADDMQAMESSTIERILLAYSLPTDLRSFRMSGVENPSSKVIKQAKLCTLFDFLGATRLADHERMKAEKWRQQRAILAY
ncbi:hypothetical protein EG327_003252 [Venturia inaequalis]|uniref:Uncharacterized protein n=1 Tax=Venturia inaequalis TaxID=5025 RepID=A0A8H3VJ65_VENIN|nr:hypothetical protein EG327_003252 [Venturia inaequalis]